MEQLGRLCEIQCTAEECAAVLGVSVDTIDRRLKEAGYENFAEFRSKYADRGKMSIRRAQFRSAVENGNVAMLIWLGKQYLGQRDRHDVDHSGGLQVTWQIGDQVIHIGDDADHTGG